MGDPSTSAYAFYLSLFYSPYLCNSYDTSLGIHPFYRWINPSPNPEIGILSQNIKLRVNKKIVESIKKLYRMCYSFINQFLRIIFSKRVTAGSLLTSAHT